jgi:hypothetical protein
MERGSSLPRVKSPAIPTGQLSLFEEVTVDQKDQTRDPVHVGSGLPRGLHVGYFGKPYEVGFDIPALPTSGYGAWLSDQIYRDVETLRIGWPESEDEANFFRRRIKRYIQSALSADSRGE